MQKPVAHKQSLFDFAIQYCGTVSAVHAIAVANNISPTAVLATGMMLTIPDDIKIDQDIIDYYANNKIVPATALTEDDYILTTNPGGIGFMSVGGSFKVS
jgi:hypothetical protein